ncbi:hypothetical protein B0H10DRAFT_2209497 [Mycena sp. CBHHK59/15]|nr:hypothetical protein B0H10DRAFT_2209497 [Mycena sp. CBHHK59/15]
MPYSAFTSSTTAEEVATVFLAQIKGKNVLITGTSLNGIGFETARVIAKYANLVVITGYNAERLKLTEEGIKKDVPSANIRQLTLDLSSLAAVRRAAAEVNASPLPLHVLIHNAAAVIGPFKLTVDKLENQFATDHVGPFLLTKLLAPKLLKSATADYTPRVVYVSSGAHAFGAGVDFDNICPNPDPTKHTSTGAYFQAKSANILTALELSKRSGGKINAYSLHPGVIFTNIHQKEESIADMQALGFIGPDRQPLENGNFEWKTIPQGAATTVAAAFDPSLNAWRVPHNSTVANDAVASHSSDPAIAEKLWTETEKIIGESFTF